MIGGLWWAHKMEFSMGHLLFPKMVYPLNSLSKHHQHNPNNQFEMKKNYNIYLLYKYKFGISHRGRSKRRDKLRRTSYKFDQSECHNHHQDNKHHTSLTSPKGMIKDKHKHYTRLISSRTTTRHYTSLISPKGATKT